MEGFWPVWLISMVCALSVIPLQYRDIKSRIDLFKMVYPVRKMISAPALLGIIIIQLYVLLGVATYLGLRVLPEVNLHIWFLEYWQKGTPIPFSLASFWFVSVFSAIMVSVLITVIDNFMFSKKMIQTRKFGKQYSVLSGVCTLFYGGVCEEVLMRLGLMSVVVFLAKLGGLQEFSYWLGIIVSAFVFGVAHLPINFLEFGKSSIVIQRTIILNGMAGFLFGWLYWQYGLESAMISHFITNLILHIILRKRAWVSYDRRNY